MPSKAKSGSRSSSNVTLDHDEIRRWVEERGGRPACVKATEKGDSCLLRIDYPGFGGEDSLEEIEGDEFFDTFDQNNLAFVYQESKNGKQSRFSKLVSRDSVGNGRSKSRSQSGG